MHIYVKENRAIGDTQWMMRCGAPELSEALNTMTEQTFGIAVRDLCKMFEIGDVQACKYVNLEIAENEFMVLLGPSGCGKTTTLRCVAGLERPDNDDAIWIKGRNVTALAPKDRNLAFVFQDTMLFPHITVRKNISFGLDMRKKLPKEEQPQIDRDQLIIHVKDSVFLIEASL